MKTKIKSKLTAGQSATIYLDPFTKQEKEGTAKLMRLDRAPMDGVEYWWVRFEGEDRDVYRRIVPNNP